MVELRANVFKNIIGGSSGSSQSCKFWDYIYSVGGNADDDGTCWGGAQSEIDNYIIDPMYTTCSAIGETTPLTTESRGYPRPMDGNSDGVSWCDIGWEEYPGDLQAGPTYTVNTNSDVTIPPGCTTGHCTLREAITVANIAPAPTQSVLVSFRTTRSP